MTTTPKRLSQHASPEDAEAAFYDALQKGDIDALMAVWSEEDEIVCIHPTGTQLVGLESIRESWRAIFSTTRLHLDAQFVAHWQGMLLSIHQLVETLFIGEEHTPHGPLHVTHVYSRGAYGWRLVSRHASSAGDESFVSAGAHASLRILH